MDKFDVPDTATDFPVLREARALEQAGGMWKAQHVAAILGIHRTSVYEIRFLIQRKVRVGRRGARWEPADVRLYQALQRGVGSGGVP